MLPLGYNREAYTFATYVCIVTETPSVGLLCARSLMYVAIAFRAYCKTFVYAFTRLRVSVGYTPELRKHWLFWPALLKRVDDRPQSDRQPHSLLPKLLYVLMHRHTPSKYK